MIYFCSVVPIFGAAALLSCPPESVPDNERMKTYEKFNVDPSECSGQHQIGDQRR